MLSQLRLLVKTMGFIRDSFAVTAAGSLAYTSNFIPE